ncbi:MAG: DUF3488 domain-containing protein [Planctomycetes bacterium]|nr:DUF3488 domain-containing protein [Planctomycetota bacterium]
MSERLLPFLLLLTLLDLAFVQATGVVTGNDLLALWLLAAAAPWLRRLQRRRWCRSTWNAAVLVVFALLVHHATTTGLLYMLEDGLLLAVLCQVHLLNNVGERQRPDLVFFNSFLVAFVTSFFAPDLTWSLLFVAHAFVLVPALQVNVFARRGVRLDGASLRTVLRDSVGLTFAVGVATAAAFVLLPRDFERHGWLGDAMNASPADAGVAERIRLDKEFPIALGNDVALRIEVVDGTPDRMPSHWRVVAFAEFDGASWSPQENDRRAARFVTDPAWTTERGGTFVRDIEPGDTTMRVRLQDRSGRRLPMPLEAQRVRVEAPDDVLVDPKSWGVLGIVRMGDRRRQDVVYTMELGATAGAVQPSPSVRRLMTNLPPSVPRMVRDLASRLRSELPDAATGSQVAGACCEWLQQHRRYELPGRPGFARNLAEFLVGAGAGHCEYFATALALLLRVQAIPCRLVGGYLVHERDPATGAFVARSRHAHAWVEVLRPDGSWLTLDPTPPADVIAASTEKTSWWHDFAAGLSNAWSRVVEFDAGSRTEWVRTIAELPGAIARSLVDHPLVAVLSLASIAGLVYRRRRRPTVATIVELERAVRTAGLSWSAGETPRELLARAAGIGLDAARLALLATAVGRHENARYGVTARGATT